jgi:hypothetical protein
MVSILFNMGLKVGSGGGGTHGSACTTLLKHIICNTLLLDFKVNMFQMILSHCQQSNNSVQKLLKFHITLVLLICGNKFLVNLQLQLYL